MMAQRHVEGLDVRLSFDVEPAPDGRALKGEQPLALKRRVALEGAWIKRAIGLAEPWTACRTSHFAADALELYVPLAERGARLGQELGVFAHGAVGLEIQYPFKLHHAHHARADAAAGARSAVMNAKEAIGEKYDNVKLNMELNQLDEKQENVFSDIGRMMFLMHTGKLKDTVMTEDGPKTPQQVIDSLLLTAEQVQQEIDALEAKLGEDGEELSCLTCPKCGNVCFEGDHYCSACGEHLTAEENAPMDVPGEDISE